MDRLSSHVSSLRAWVSGICGQTITPVPRLEIPKPRCWRVIPPRRDPITWVPITAAPIRYLKPESAVALPASGRHPGYQYRQAEFLSPLFGALSLTTRSVDSSIRAVVIISCEPPGTHETAGGRTTRTSAEGIADKRRTLDPHRRLVRCRKDQRIWMTTLSAAQLISSWVRDVLSQPQHHARRDSISKVFECRSRSAELSDAHERSTAVVRVPTISPEGTLPIIASAAS